MVQEGLQNQEGSGSQSYDFEEKISKEKIDRIQKSEEEILMAKKSKLRRIKATRRRQKRDYEDASFELSLDATYGLGQKSLFNFGRSMGLSKIKSRRASKRLTKRKGY